jgi:stage II sporulation protein D
MFSLPVRVSSSSGVGWKETMYRGELRIIGAQKGFTVINEVDVENYIRGILKIEMNPDWPREALKAQAILARTYAVKNRGRFANRGFDLDSTENSQIYRGMNAEDPRTDAAVKDTTGQVLTWDGKAADIYYHSDSGGATADIAHVWGGYAPYLKPQLESMAYTSPYSSWQASLTPAQVAAVMRKIGKDVGSVSAVDVALKDEHGRAVHLRVKGDRGTVEVKAHAFRMAAGSSVIRSTNFNISGGSVTGERASSQAPAQLPTQPTAPAPVKALSLTEIAFQNDPLLEMTKNGIFSKEELFDMLMNSSKRDSYLKIGLERLAGAVAGKQPAPAPAPNPVPVPQPAAASGSFTFSGKGWGHGVGLSQWGAKAMADSGKKCQEILSHYFPGTKIAR